MTRLFKPFVQSFVSFMQGFVKSSRPKKAIALIVFAKKIAKTIIFCTAKAPHKMAVFLHTTCLKKLHLINQSPC